MTKKLTENLIFSLGMLLIFLVYLFTRYPALNIEDSFRFYNSDFAIFTMMAEDIAMGRPFPFFYYGGNYLGPLNAILQNIMAMVMHILGIVEVVPVGPPSQYIIGPLTSTLTCFFTLFLGILFWGMSFRKIFSVGESLLACLLLSLGSALLVRSSLRPLAPEIAFMLGGLLMWRGQLLVGRNSFKNQLIFGICSGISWWMNQTVIFVLAPILFYIVARSPQYRSLRSNLNIRGRAFICMKSLNLSVISKRLKSFILFVHGILFLNLIMGIVISLIGGVNTKFFGVKLKILNGFSPIKTSIMIFVIVQFLLWFFKSKNAKNEVKKVVIPLKVFIIGFFLGYGPVLLGRLFRLYEKGYGPKFQFVKALDIFPYWWKIISVFIPNLLTNNLDVSSGISLLLSILFYSSIIFLILLLILKNRVKFIDYILLKPGEYSKESLFWGVVFFNLLYVGLAERARDQFAYRYVILCLPILSIFITQLFRKLKYMKFNGFFSFCIVTTAFLSLSFANYLQGAAQLKKIKVSEHQLEKMKVLYDSDCEIFFSDYWKTYLYEWLLQGKKQFGIIRGQDRTPKKTKALKESSMKKCVINDDWTIASYD